MKYRYRILIPFAALSVWACTDVSDTPDISESITDAVEFSGEVRGEDRNISRFEDIGDGSVWLDMKYDTWIWNDFADESRKIPIDFVIHQQTASTEGNTANIAIYRLKPGEANRLVCADGYTPLNWVSKTARHLFHAWTEPAGVTMNDMRENGTVDMTRRNPDYEYFVGETTDKLSYIEHGISVGLRFRHLVGKIVIDKASLIYSDGNENKDIWYNLKTVSFPNMPVSGDFTTGIGGSGVMEVVHDNNRKGVTFRLSDTEYGQYVKNHAIPFYILPMSFVDGNDNGKFFVTLEHPNGEYRMYEGDLRELVNENAPDNPLAEIKAGECLTIRLVLKDDKVDGFFVYVSNWNTAEERPVKDNAYPGIYTVDDMVKIARGDGATFVLTPTDDMVYETTENGKKIIRLYDNLDLSAFPDVRHLIIPDGYVLDGLGHNITGNPQLEFRGDIRNLFVNGRSSEASDD